MRLSRQRLYASLMILGAGFLLYRTVSLTAAGYLDIYVLWVSILLIAEMVVDLSCLLASVRWWTHHHGAGSTLALRLGTAVVFIHAVRVLVFALGRTDPFRDFDIAPGQRISIRELGPGSACISPQASPSCR